MRVRANGKLDEVLEKRFNELLDKEPELTDEEEEELDKLSDWHDEYEDYTLATLDIVEYYETQGVTFV